MEAVARLRCDLSFDTYSDELYSVPFPLGPATVLFPLTMMFYVQNSNVSLRLRCI